MTEIYFVMTPEDLNMSHAWRTTLFQAWLDFTVFLAKVNVYIFSDPATKKMTVTFSRNRTRQFPAMAALSWYRQSDFPISS